MGVEAEAHAECAVAAGAVEPRLPAASPRPGPPQSRRRSARICSARRRSTRSVILKFSGEPSTTATRPPRASTSEASSVAAARTSSGCGVGVHAAPASGRSAGSAPARGGRRSGVLDDEPVLVDDLDGVGAGDAEHRPVQRRVGGQSVPPPGAISSQVTSGRAPSCTPTRSQVPASARARSPLRTENGRFVAPGHHPHHLARCAPGAISCAQYSTSSSLTTTTRASTSGHDAEGAQRPLQHGDAEQGHVLLGHARVEPRAVAGRRHHQREADVRASCRIRVPPHEASRVKIILPDGFCSTEVTSTSTSSPTRSRPPSMTTMVPSSR